MKTSINKLPKAKQKDLKQICDKTHSMCQDIVMIILFGSYARGSWKEDSDLAPDRKSGHKSDYDILVVTQDKKTAHNTVLWHEITKACDQLKLSTHARIIAHDIEYLNIQLAENHYFFSDIKKEGILLFDSGEFQLADKRELTDEEQKRIAQDHFDHWFGTQNNASPSHENPKNFVRNGKEVGEIRGYSCQIVADEFIDWLKRHRQKK